MPIEPLDAKTVTVIGSRAAFHSDGTTAIILHTQEAGPIAFVVNLDAIASLRQDLLEAEAFLNRGTGSA